MSGLLGSPALRLLLRLKLGGLVRRQWRRLHTPKGFLLTLVGVLALVVWIGSLAVTYSREAVPLAGQAAEMRVRAFGAVLFLLSLSTALTNRGLYLHKSEIERLFSAPLARSDLVRYRLVAGSLRSLLGGVVLGLFGAHRLPNPPLAFLAIVLAMQTLPVVNQLVAIALGGLEGRASAVLKRVGLALLFGGLALAAGAAFALTRRDARSPVFGDWPESLFRLDQTLLEHPLARSLSLPFLPWGRAISAASLAEFAPWFLACLALHGLLIELCARLPIDFRELSLSTSVRAAARLARFRRGGGVAASRASTRAARWRIPWFFGRGPAGAIAWRKCAGMARKAKGALGLALVALLFITVFVGLLVHGDPAGEALYSPVAIAVLGTIYLCSGLRFDFREELERMDAIRAWPLAPARVFLAMLLPEVLLVSFLVGGTVLVNSTLQYGPSFHAAAIGACLPFLVFAWVALDNIVFLFAPVRFVPGQDGFVQNAGRRMIQMALLLALVGLFTLFGWLGSLGATALAGRFAPGSEALARVAVFLGLVLVLAAGDLLLVLLGGFVLRRFDVASDRG